MYMEVQNLINRSHLKIVAASEVLTHIDTLAKTLQ